MAVKETSKTMGDFSRYYKKLIFWVVTAFQLITNAGLALVLFSVGAIRYDEPMSWTLLFGILFLSTSVMLMFYKIATDPLYDILAALIHKKGELTVTTPPNPNAKRNRETGFKAVLEAIYSATMQQPESLMDPNEKSQQKTNEENLPSLEEALSHTSYGVVILDADKNIISANRSAPVTKRQDGSLFFALNFINEPTIEEWLDDVDQQTINSERRWQRVSTNPRFIKKQRFFDIVASYEKGAKAETVVFLLEQNGRYVDEEEDFNFIAFAAHELRGPIAIIRGYLDVLEEELSDRIKSDEKEMFKRLTVSANRLSGYINNILNVAKLDRHHLSVYLYEDSVADIYQSVSQEVALNVQAQHRLLNVEIAENLPTVAADRGSISEVISNLIDNAIKYSFEGGSITIKAEKKGDFVEISVIDNGIGMPTSVIRNLFKKFYRSHRSRDSVAGTGIGLYVCKAIVDSHGGTMTVRSQENHGSTFSFTLPIYATVADKLLEDNQSNQSLIRHGGGWIKNHNMYRD